MSFDVSHTQRLALISLVMQTVRTLSGRKRLQKMIYLLDVSGWRCFEDFKFHNYGTYSETLVKEIQIMTENDWLHEMPKDTSVGATIFNYSIPAKRDSILSGLISRARNEKLVKRTSGLIRQLDAFETSDLEIMSTLVYLKKFKPDLGDDELVDLAHKLKPQFNIDEIIKGKRIFGILKPFS